MTHSLLIFFSFSIGGSSHSVVGRGTMSGKLDTRTVSIFQDATLVNETVDVEYVAGQVVNYSLPAAASEVVVAVESSAIQRQPVVILAYTISEPLVTIGYLPERSKGVARGIVLTEESDEQCLKLRDFAADRTAAAATTRSFPRKNLWIDEGERTKMLTLTFDVSRRESKSSSPAYQGVLIVSYRLPLITWKFLHTLTISDTHKGGAASASGGAPYFAKHRASLVTSVKLDSHVAMISGLTGVMDKVNLINKRLGHASQRTQNVGYGGAPRRTTMMKAFRASPQEETAVLETTASPSQTASEFGVSQDEGLGYWTFENMEFSPLGGVSMALVRDKLISVFLANTINYSAAMGDSRSVSQTLVFSFDERTAVGGGGGRSKQSETQLVLNEIEPGALQVYIDGLLVNDSLMLTSETNMLNLGTLPAIALVRETDGTSLRHNYTQERLVLINRSATPIQVVYVSDSDIRRIKRVETKQEGEEGYETREEFKALTIPAERAAHVFEPIQVAAKARLVHVHRLYSTEAAAVIVETTTS
jgi:hypothetical protein